MPILWQRCGQIKIHMPAIMTAGSTVCLTSNLRIKTVLLQGRWGEKSLPPPTAAGCRKQKVYFRRIIPIILTHPFIPIMIWEEVRDIMPVTDQRRRQSSPGPWIFWWAEMLLSITVRSWEWKAPERMKTKGLLCIFHLTLPLKECVKGLRIWMK